MEACRARGSLRYPSGRVGHEVKTHRVMVANKAAAQDGCVVPVQPSADSNKHTSGDHIL